MFYEKSSYQYLELVLTIEYVWAEAVHYLHNSDVHSFKVLFCLQIELIIIDKSTKVK